MGIPLYHHQSFMTGNSLHGRKIDAGLHKMGDRRVAESVTDNYSGIKPCGNDDAGKGFADIDGRSTPCCRIGKI
jgi:hypothetical protein